MRIDGINSTGQSCVTIVTEKTGIPEKGAWRKWRPRPKQRDQANLIFVGRFEVVEEKKGPGGSGRWYHLLKITTFKELSSSRVNAYRIRCGIWY